MGAQTVFQLLFRILDAVGDLRGQEAIVFQYFVDGRFGDQTFFLRDLCAGASQHDGGHTADGLLENVLIVLLSLADLFVKPSHCSASPQSLEMSSV